MVRRVSIEPGISARSSRECPAKNRPQPPAATCASSGLDARLACSGLAGTDIETTWTLVAHPLGDVADTFGHRAALPPTCRLVTVTLRSARTDDSHLAGAGSLA